MSIMTPIETVRLTPKPGRLCPTGCMLLGNANVKYDPINGGEANFGAVGTTLRGVTPLTGAKQISLLSSTNFKVTSKQINFRLL